MFPQQFFELTPHEVVAWLSPALQGRIAVAWDHEAVHRMRKIPQKPSDLWKDPLKPQTPEQMYRNMRAFMEELKKNAKPKPKKKK
ncbi:MAG: hypothetical protein EOS58_30775 [Mesorhizobium sp.]|nr:MAG: hypothetical protein EOS58_30775 [Mesorhizobium sp.]TIW21460.1 MAG: hypothetical protein E5V63_29325 [Mesorhizobium sp.]